VDCDLLGGDRRAGREGLTGLAVRSRAGLPRGPWRGAAALAFERTAWFDDGADALVGVMERGVGPSPAGLELQGPLPRVRAGALLRSDGSRWFLEGAGELAGAAEAPEVSAALTAAAQGPAEDDRSRCGGGASEAWLGRWSAWLSRALPDTEEGRWLSGLLWGPADGWEALLGRGSGSTPSGDDYLAGWLAARLRLGRATDGDRSRLRAALPRTTKLSRHYLRHLAEGRVDRAIAAFLASPPWPEPGSFEAFALASRGHLSGLAMLAGLVAGLAAGA
jgi:hypothetical protein